VTTQRDASDGGAGRAMSDDEDVKKEVKEDHINIKVKDMVRREATRGREATPNDDDDGF
jgi:hypothetical protein